MRTAGSHVHHTPWKRRSFFFLPLAKRFGKGRSPPPPRAHSAPRTATGIPFLFFFFALDVPTTLQVSDECELQNNLPLFVVPKTSRRNLFGATRNAREGFSLHLYIEWRCLSLHNFDHQLLTGEADSDEVQLLTVGVEAEDDLFLPTFVKVGEFCLNDARGSQRCRRRGPGVRHASRGTDVLFFCRREREVQHICGSGSRG